MRKNQKNKKYRKWIVEIGMGWDKLWVLVSPPLKRLFKGPPPSFPGFHLLGWQGYSQEKSPPRSRVYRQIHTDRSDPTILLCSDFEKEDAWIHRRRNLLESREGGCCSSPQKEEVARVHRRREPFVSPDLKKKKRFKIFEAVQRQRRPLYKLTWYERGIW